MSLFQKLMGRVAGVIALGLVCASAQATVLTSFTAKVTSTDPTQVGRLVRTGTPQDWAGSMLFPGTNNTSTTFNYHVYDLDLEALEATSYGGYIQVTFDSVSTSTFLAAYLGTYNPSSATTMAATWLGDPGTSGNYYGVNPLYFQVYVPQGSHLLLVLNTTASAGLNAAGLVTVEAYSDTDYTDLPEPTSLALAGLGVIGAFRLRRRKAQA